jgi:hypothetical protein
MNTRRLIPALAAVLACSTFAGCSDDPSDPPPAKPPVSQDPIACRASVSPGTLPYTLGDSGKMLVLAGGTTDEKTLERIGTPSTMIYGSWLLQQISTPVQLRAELVFETGRASLVARCTARGKTVTATATSPATITDRQVTILQPNGAVVYIP